MQPAEARQSNDARAVLLRYATQICLHVCARSLIRNQGGNSKLNFSYKLILLF